jgi:glucose/arabinose dehydrogenase
VTLLRDADGDGVAEVRSVLLKDINSSFGLAVDGQDLFVTTVDAILRYR